MIKRADQMIMKEAKRRGFKYVGWIFETYHPSSPNEIVTHEDILCALNYIAHMAKKRGVVYASEMSVRKVIVNNGVGLRNSKAFTQWEKKVQSIDLRPKIHYDVRLEP